MKKIYLFFLVLLFGAASALPVFAADADLSNLVRLKITGSGIAVRAEANAKGRVLGKASTNPKNQFFIAYREPVRDSENVEWYKIAYVVTQQEERIYDVPSEYYDYGGAPEAYISAKLAQAVKLDSWDKERITSLLDPKSPYTHDEILAFSLSVPLRLKDYAFLEKPDSIVEPGTEIYIKIDALFYTMFGGDDRIISIWKKKDDEFGSMLGSALFYEVMAAEKFFTAENGLSANNNSSERPVLHINDDSLYDHHIKDSRYDEHAEGKPATPEFSLSVPLKLKYSPDIKAPVEATVPANTTIALFAPPFLYSDSDGNMWRMILSRKNESRCLFLGFVNETEFAKITTSKPDVIGH